MNFSTIQLGDKVQPVAKTASDPGQSLFRSETWKYAKRISQPFLYVQAKTDCEVMLGIDRNAENGQLFTCDQFERYNYGN